MPDGKTHDMLTLVSGVGGLPIVWTLLPDHSIGATLTWFGAHMVSGIAFSPDLDLASAPYKRWGPFRFIWYPYRELINHRAWVSHSLVFGPLLRLGYFVLVCWLLAWIMFWGIGHFITFDGSALVHQFQTSLLQLWHEQRRGIVMFLLGFVSGGAVHTFADWLTEATEPFHRSLFKPRLRRRRKKKDDEWGLG